MGFVPEIDAQRKAATREKILETGFQLFAEKTINAVNLTDVANAAGVSFMTVYRHFDKKPDLVLAINTWSWEQYMKKDVYRPDTSGMKAAEVYELLLDRFIDLYREDRNMLRFNQYFNAYIKNQKVPAAPMESFGEVMDSIRAKFHEAYEMGKTDGTLRTDVPENEIFSATLHLMLAAVTRYAVGLAYDAGIEPEKELLLLKKMLMREYTVQ